MCTVTGLTGLGPAAVLEARRAAVGARGGGGRGGAGRPWGRRAAASRQQRPACPGVSRCSHASRRCQTLREVGVRWQGSPVTRPQNPPLPPSPMRRPTARGRLREGRTQAGSPGGGALGLHASGTCTQAQRDTRRGGKQGGSPEQGRGHSGTRDGDVGAGGCAGERLQWRRQAVPPGQLCLLSRGQGARSMDLETVSTHQASSGT